jgi:alpha-amylase/alpha-mannosidase (GH57 family)
MNRKVCIHGHFYQPPRENAWLEEVEVEDSAYPYHDWNERITAECYGPNSASRILDAEGKIASIINNYTRISFNVGPTLLLWMRRHEPEVYEAVLRADKESRERFSGHGGAIAQAYNHMIMPLANLRDKRTQVLWGLRDFGYRFGRKPEGMWLPETAVDVETLDIMAEQGMKFTILAPHQAAQIRKKGQKEWSDAASAAIDPRRPYSCPLPSGRTIAIFFYDGPLAHDVAFGDLLKSGEQFAQRLLRSFAVKDNGPQLVHIATDGETYGHHHAFGDMALAYCLSRLESNRETELTVYGEHLEKYPPVEEVEVKENSSWSCTHGVERWRQDCGCSTGMHPGWRQAWRAPLREAMDWLRDGLADLYEREMAKLVADPWKARDDYVEVVLDRRTENVDAFLARQSRRRLSSEEASRALRLLEIQRHAMLMFTSCGWFFDDISGIESVQVLRYASRAMQLAKDVEGKDWEPKFLSFLEKAPSNVPEYKNGKKIFRLQVSPAAVDLRRVGAHYAISSLFEKYPDTATFGSFTAKKEKVRISQADHQKMAVGRVRLRSEIIRDDEDLVFTALHTGGHNLIAGVRQFPGDEALAAFQRKIEEAFGRGEIPKVIELTEKFFGSPIYSFRDLFRDEKYRVVGQISEATLKEIDDHFHRIYEDNYPTMLAMKDMGIPLPRPFSASLEIILNRDLERLLRSDEPNFRQIKSVSDKISKWLLEPDRSALGYAATQTMNRLMSVLSQDPLDVKTLKAIESLFLVLGKLKLEINLWKSQEVFFFIMRDRYRGMKAKADKRERVARDWVAAAAQVAKILGVKVE